MSAKNSLITICLVVLTICALALTYGFVKRNLDLYNKDIQPTVEECEDYTPLSVEEAVELFEEEKYLDECTNLFYSLPTPIIRELYNKLGTEKFIREYVEEYMNNKEYYYSVLYKSKIEQKIEGDKDVENIQIKVKLKEEKKDTSKIHVEVDKPEKSD